MFDTKIPYMALITTIRHHILRCYTISLVRIIEENMGDGAHQLTLLHNGTAAHALHNAAAFVKQLLICNLYDKIFI